MAGCILAREATGGVFSFTRSGTFVSEYASTRELHRVKVITGTPLTSSDGSTRAM